MPEPLGADVMEAVVPPTRIAEHGDESPAHFRRQRSRASSVPAIVSTTMTAFLP